MKYYCKNCGSELSTGGDIPLEYSCIYCVDGKYEPVPDSVGTLKNDGDYDTYWQFLKESGLLRKMSCDVINKIWHYFRREGV